MLSSWNFINLSSLAPACLVPVLAAGRRSGTLLSDTGPSHAGILAGSSPPGPFPSRQLSCAEASWKYKNIFFNLPKTWSLMSPEDNAWNENMACKRSINKTYPLSTRKESLHVLPFLFNWNLENDEKEIRKVRSDHTVTFELSQHSHSIFKSHPWMALKRTWCSTFIFGL